jgi:hypothetical protein
MAPIDSKKVDITFRKNEKFESVCGFFWSFLKQSLNNYYLQKQLIDYKIMEPFIREKRKLFFEKKIITPGVIREFANIIRNEMKSLGSKDEAFAIFSIDACDNSSYESRSPEIFREGDLLDKKEAAKVSMRFNTRDYVKSIEVQLVHILDADGETAGAENFILVSGDDPIWVNGVLARYNEIITLTEDQVGYKKIVGWSVFITFVILNVIYFRLFYSVIEKIENGWTSMMFSLGFPILSMVFADKLADYIKSIWPDMEFQTGPGYLQKTALKRKKVTWIMMTIFIPILIGIAYDLIKSYV